MAQVSDYFMVSDSARVRLRCDGRRTLPLLRGETVDGVEVDRNFTWTFAHGKVEPEQSRFISDVASDGKGDAMDNMLLAAGGAAHEGVTCRVYREYRARGEVAICT